MASEENEKVRDEKVEETTSSQSDIDDLSSVSQDDIDCFFTSNYGKILNFVTESVKEYPAPSSDQPYTYQPFYLFRENGSEVFWRLKVAKYDENNVLVGYDTVFYRIADQKFKNIYFRYDGQNLFTNCSGFDETYILLSASQAEMKVEDKYSVKTLKQLEDEEQCRMLLAAEEVTVKEINTRHGIVY